MPAVNIDPKVHKFYAYFRFTLHMDQLLKSKTVKQTAILFASQMALLAIGFGIKTIQTKLLGPAAYGLYAFFGSFTVFTALFFRFGFFASLQVLLAENKEENKEKELFGLGLIVSAVIGIVYAVFVWVFSFYVDQLFSSHIGDVLRILSPLTFIIPFRSAIVALSVGSNKVHLLPVYDNLAKLLFLGVLLVYFYSDAITVFQVTLFNLLTLLIAIFPIIKNLKPRFKNRRTHFTTLWQKTKTYGFHFYLGSTTNQSTFRLDELAIVYFIGTTVNGFYSLANIIASPIALGSQALSNSLFKRFSVQAYIPKKVFIYNTLWLVLAVALFYLLVDWLVFVLFGTEFSDVSKYAIAVSLVFFLQGLAEPFKFLSAKSLGKEIRNVGLAEAFINVSGNLILIPIYGVFGAIYTSLIAKLFNLIAKAIYYKRYIKKNNS